MKNKKFILGTVLAVLMIGVFSFVTLQFQDSYAMSDNAVNEYNAVYIPEGTSAAPGDKVDVELMSTDNWDYISLSMHSTTSDDYFTVYLGNVNSHSLENPAFFILPEPGNTYSSNTDGAKVGETYEIRQYTLFKGDYMVTYSAYDSNDKNYIDLGNRKYVKVVQGNDNNVGVSNIKLNSFNLKTTKAKIYDYVYLDIGYTGKATYGYLGLVNKDTGQWIYLSIYDLEYNNPYIYLDEFSWFNDGTYKVQTLTLLDERGVAFDFVSPGVKGDDFYVDAPEFQFNGELELTRGDNKVKVDLKDISISKETAQINEEVGVTISSSSDLESVLLTFSSEDGKNHTINSYVKSINDNPFFLIPFNASRGRYYLNSVVLKDKDGNMSYYKLGNADTHSQNLNKYISLTIGGDFSNIDKSTAYINNLDYDDRILASLDETDEDSIITINASGNPIINKELFNVIRGTRRTLILEYYDSEWVFSGTDIISPKSIDVSMGYEEMTSNNIGNADIVNDIDKQSLVLTFANNGDLPGKALIKLKSNKIDDLFAGDALYIYYFNDQNSLDPVAMEIHRDNGYYDFYIDHNSKYILTKKKLSGNYVTDNNKYLNLNTKNNSSTKASVDNNMLVACGVVIVLLVIVIIALLAQNKKKSASKKTSKGNKK